MQTSRGRLDVLWGNCTDIENYYLTGKAPSIKSTNFACKKSD
ncbi:hypothetical protein HMPREF9446_00493 [Bacteroides fluxus YIT 12057]|uniref:Uncharacterized protein n=1 Tax=Bacteroides fluxus YIT 12057 TaxID=763034 RepID=F3PP53_9BACE|nr:hypothetical protein HMPREF9446_00493 [Bacteroides fluxus YIT 12057]